MVTKWQYYRARDEDLKKKKTIKSKNDLFLHQQLKHGLNLPFFFFFFLPSHIAPRILVPSLGIEPRSPEVKVWSSINWTTREVPNLLFKIYSARFFFYLVITYYWISVAIIMLRRSLNML